MRNLLPSLRHGLCTSLFLVFSSLLYSQGNLQFNRVININLRADINNPSGYKVDTVIFCVPLNKVWKIESCDYPGGSGSVVWLSHSSASNYGSLSPDPTVRLKSAQGYSWEAKFPIWLKSGYCGTFVYYSGTQLELFYTGLISIIEFNVVP